MFHIRFAIYFTVFLLVSVALHAGSLHYINDTVVYLHALPNASEEVVSSASYGTTVRVTHQEGGWMRIRLTGDCVGWVAKQDVCCRETPYAEGERIARIKTNCAHIYSVPDTTPHPPILSVPLGTQLPVISEPEQQERRWIVVELLNGERGWIQRGDVSLGSEKLALNEMVHLSQQCLGIPYTWGGATSFGLDCSGYVRMLYDQMGITLPHNSRRQAAMFAKQSVERDRLQVGDLVFFGPIGSDRITHVGLYLGDDQFIHACTGINGLSPVVQISTLSDEFWTAKYKAARRVVG